MSKKKEGTNIEKKKEEHQNERNNHNATDGVLPLY